MQNFNVVEDLREMIQSKDKLKAAENNLKNFQNSKKKLGLDPDVVTCDEQDIISAFQVAFEGEIILTQHCIKKKRVDVYFPKYKLGIEIHEYNHEGRNFEYGQSRKLRIEGHGISIIGTNPDAVDFDMNRLIKHTHTLLNQLKITN